MSKSRLGDTLSNRPFRTDSSLALPTDERLNAKFKFHDALIRNYIKYSHEVESMNKSQIKERVIPMINSLIEEHQFGSKFASGLMTYLNSRFVQPKSTVYSNIKADSGLTELVFESLMGDFVSSPFINGYSSSFRQILK